MGTWTPYDGHLYPLYPPGFRQVEFRKADTNGDGRGLHQPTFRLNLSRF